ncbi:hypothetical protein FAIPA1_430033 [Frankia sp. AiPs1]
MMPGHVGEARWRPDAAGQRDVVGGGDVVAEPVPGQRAGQAERGARLAGGSPRERGQRGIDHPWLRIDTTADAADRTGRVQAAEGHPGKARRDGLIQTKHRGQSLKTHDPSQLLTAP